MAQYELNLRDYFRILRKRRFIVITTFLLATSASLFYHTETPLLVYKSSVTVKIDQRKTIAGLLTEEVLINPGDMMESEAELITSFPVLQKTALRLHKINDKSTSGEVDAVVGQFRNSIVPQRIGATNMIKITATALTPQDAMELANTIAQVYIEENLSDKAKVTRHARQFIEEQLSSIEIRLSKAEERLRDIAPKVAGKDLSLVKDPIQEQLIALETELAGLLQQYTDKHPRVLQLKDMIKNLEAKLVPRESVVTDDESSVSYELEYARLVREIEVNKGLYGILREKLEEARISEAQKVSDVSVVNPAVLPGESMTQDQVNPNIKFVIGPALGLILGIAFAFIFETFDTSISTIEDVENVVKLSLLGVVPSFEEEFKGKISFGVRLKRRFWHEHKTDEEERLVRLISHFKPNSSIAEAYRNIYTNLKLDASKKTILVTSASPGEGKTAVVCNLGIITAQLGLKTLLVSTDLRRPALAKMFGIRREPGLTELLIKTVTIENVLNNITDIMLGEIKFEDLTKTPGIENICIIPSGKPPSNPVELLESKDLHDLILTLRQEFDVLIFDSPPILAVTDANLLASIVDSVILVYEIGHTSREALIRSKMQLESVGAKIAGVILNNTRPQVESIASYPYYSHRYRYYASEQQPDAAVKKEMRRRHT